MDAHTVRLSIISCISRDAARSPRCPFHLHVNRSRLILIRSATNPHPSLTSTTTSLSLSATFKMLFSQLPVLLLAAVMLPSFAEAGMFYKNSPVKMLDAKSFKKAMRENVGWAFVWSVVSFESSLANVGWVME